MTTMGNALQMGNDCIDRHCADAFGSGKERQEPGQGPVDGRVRAVRRQNDSGSHFPRPMRECQDIQRVAKANVVGILFDFPEFSLHFEFLIFRRAGRRGHIMES